MPAIPKPISLLTPTFIMPTQDPFHYCTVLANAYVIENSDFDADADADASRISDFAEKFPKDVFFFLSYLVKTISLSIIAYT